MGILDQWASTAQSSISAIRSQQSGIDPSQTSTDPMLVTSNRKYLIQITQAQDIATIGTQGQPIVVIGQVPEDLQMNQSVAWKAPWGAGLAGDGTISDLLAVTQGTRLLSQVQTLQVWQGAGNDVDFTITFEFRAWSDVDRDVMIPLRSLSSMALPSLDPSSGFLRSPGPILDAAAAQQIGQAAVSLVQQISDNTSTSLATLTDGSLLSKAQKVFSSATSTIGSNLASSKNALEQLLKNKIEVRIGDWFRLPNVIIKDVQHTMRSQMPGPNGGLMSATATVTFAPLFALTTDDLNSLLMTSNQRFVSQNFLNNL
jgi:hypothetical protein